MTSYLYHQIMAIEQTIAQLEALQRPCPSASTAEQIDHLKDAAITLRQLARAVRCSITQPLHEP